MFPKAKNLRCFWNKLLMNLCICIWINGGWDSWTAISWRQHPVEWIFNYYTRLAEGSHERSLLGVLYGLVGSARNNPSFLTLTSVASTATWATGGTFGSDHVWWDFPRYEVNLVSDFFFHVSSGLRAYICIFKYIYIRIYNSISCTCVLQLATTCPYWELIQFRIYEPMSGGFHTTWPKLRSSKRKWCLLDQLRSSLPALRRLIREDHLRGYFCKRCWYCMILENDPSSKETCWFVVIPVGSIPTQHKSVYANIPVQQITHLSPA